MAQLTTTYAGLTLQNPIIISSSGLTNSAAKIKELEKSGAGAVVLKSVFEEQINMQAGNMQGYGSPEADDYLGAYVRSHALNEHIALIQEAKKSCSIPIIASINCYSDNEWVDFAVMMEQAGADALEINILSLQTSKDYTFGSFEQRHIDILRHIKKVVKIPVIMKLGSNLTNPIALINQLYANGAAAVVLFNRFYQPDINIDTQTFTSSNVMSTPNELAKVHGGRAGEDGGSVGGIGHHGAQLRAGKRQTAVDDGHEHTSDHAGARNLEGNALVIGNAQLVDSLGDDDAKGERREQVHGLIAGQKALHGSTGIIGSLRRGSGTQRRDHGGTHNQHDKGNERGARNAAEHACDDARAQRERKRDDKEADGKHQARRAERDALGQQRHQHLEGRGARARNGFLNNHNFQVL